MARIISETTPTTSPQSQRTPTQSSKSLKVPEQSDHQMPHLSTMQQQQQRQQHWFELLQPPIQFSILACGVFFFFGIHNYLQEAIMHVPGFTFGVMLGWLEVLGVTVCSFFERHVIARETQRVAPLSAYPLLTFCLLSSSSLSNLALNYINFPTKVVFRSCKLIPTMVVASIVHRKIFSLTEYFCAICISVGLVLFAAADWELAPSFHPIGLAFVSLSVCADAVLPNAQERLFRLGSSRLEVTFFTNIFTLIAMTITTLMSGDLVGMMTFARNNSQLQLYIAIYTFVAYIAISVHMNVVKRFGGVAAVLLATGRKGMTLILSFLLFPKAFSWFYVLGACLVLGGLLLSSLVKVYSKKNKDTRTQRETADVRVASPTNAKIPNNTDEHYQDLERHGSPNDKNGHLEMTERLLVDPPSTHKSSNGSGSGIIGALFGRSRHHHQQ